MKDGECELVIDHATHDCVALCCYVAVIVTPFVLALQAHCENGDKDL